jgi:transcriptional regulator with XRE-family HTH domain
LNGSWLMAEDRNKQGTKSRPPPGIPGGNTRRLRAAHGLSQEGLAHECGINRTYLRSVERSERNVSIDDIARISRGLRIEPWKLLSDD